MNSMRTLFMTLGVISILVEICFLVSRKQLINGVVKPSATATALSMQQSLHAASVGKMPLLEQASRVSYTLNNTVHATTSGRPSQKYDQPFTGIGHATQSVTIVTGFWPPDKMAVRKRSDSVYWNDWIPSLMKVKTPIIAHVADNSVGRRLSELRGGLPLIIVESPISTFYSGKYRGFIQNTTEPERFMYAVDYCLVMHEKAFLMKRAVESNPFNSSFFFWMDIGLDRSGFLPGKSWPAILPACVLEGRVIVNDVMGRITNLCGGRREAKDIISLFAYPHTGIGGGLFGGSGKAVLAFVDEYYSTVDSFIAANATRLTSDQMILSSLACASKVSAVVPPPKSDVWFYLLHSLGDANSQITCPFDPDFQKCKQMLTQNMPVDKLGKLRVHHWEAGTGKWNEERRWDPLKLAAPCTIWYVGANTQGTDGLRLQKEYGCNMSIFEPVPTFNQELRMNWKDVPRSQIWAYGLGASSRKVEHVAVEGQSTFTMNSQLQMDGETIVIRSVEEVWTETNVVKLDMLHVNCEGCEWELLDALLSSGLASKIDVIQFGTHFFPEIENIQEKYCIINSKLSKTHHKVYQQAFGWERWTK